MRKLVNFVFSKIKGENYLLDSNLSLFEVFGFVFERGKMFLRGLLYKPFFKKSKGLLFLGRRVCFFSKKKIIFEGTATIGDFSKIHALSKRGIVFGKNFHLGEHSIIECTGVIRNLGEGLVIGDNVGISANCFIGVRGNVVIGHDTIMGPGVSIHAENHVFDNVDELIRLQGENRKGITIGANCWIGAKATILDGVAIGDGAVVAAGAVVTRDVPSNSVVAGVPAKVIKKRG